MKKLLKQLVFAAMALFLASCSSEILNEGNKLEIESNNVEITASQEQIKNDGDFFETTRTALDPNTSDGTINWVLGDCVNIFDGTSNHKYSVTSTKGSNCVFSSQGVGASKNATDFAAVYPYDMKTTYSNGKLCGFVLPNNQEATDGGFDPSCNIMVARSNQLMSTFQFKHICSYIKVKTAFDCSRIVIEFNDKKAVVAGKFDVEVSETEAPKIENIQGNSENSNIVRLLGDIKANTDYYIAVLPGTYIGGFKVTLEPKNSRDMIDWDKKTITISPRYREGRNDLVMQRAYDKSFGTFTKDNSPEETSSTIVKFEDVLGYQANAQSGKIILWAKMNLGANNETDAGNYYAWGEVEPRDNEYNNTNYLCTEYYPVNLDQAHDAAAVEYGKGWKIPSEAEFTELKEKTIWKYDETAKGYYIYPAIKIGNQTFADYQLMPDNVIYHVPTGMDKPKEKLDENSEAAKKIRELTPDKDAHLFLNLAGFKGEGNLKDVIDYGSKGAYWTNGRGNDFLYSSNYKSELVAYYLGMDNEHFNMKSYFKTRYYGFTIRPVFVVE